MFIEPVTPKLPVICALPVNGNDAALAAFNAYEAVIANEAVVANDELID